MHHAADRATAAPGPGGTPDSGPDLAPGSSRGGGSRRLGPDILRLSLVAALIVRAGLSAADAVAVARGGVQPIPFGPSVAFGAATPFWPILWALLALAGGIGLLYRSAAGWVLAGAACLGYLAAGIGDLGLLDTSASVADPGIWYVFLVDLVIPAVVLVGLYQLRHGYLRVTVRPGLAGRRIRRSRQ